MNPPLKFQKEFPVQWADLDPNYHVRHTVYSHYASETRIAFFLRAQLMPDFLKAQNIGPLLYREDIRYHNEATLGETLIVNCLVTAITENASKINISNEIVLKSSGKTAALIKSTTLWFDLTTRKLVKPPPEVAAAFSELQQDES